jgi:hypothetical protein
MDGICTLANDRVYDQLIALLNSIEAISGSQTPVCIYPYDNNTDRIAAEIALRPNVQLYSDRTSIEKWDRFAKAAWDTHPSARDRWQKVGSSDYHRFGTHRRYCAFDAPFERFLYMDADTLLMDAIEPIFNQLDRSDFVVYDFQYKDPAHVYELSSSKLNEIFPSQRVQKEIFCSGFYASKKDLFDETKRNWTLEQLKSGEAEILYPMAPDQTLLNYMMMRSGFSIDNLALQLPKNKITGCSVTSKHFKRQNSLLYDKGNRLTYLHYIGISSKIFERVCQGENLSFPYRDLFLYYRYLHEPEKHPVFQEKAKPYMRSPNKAKQFLKKLGLTF